MYCTVLCATIGLLNCHILHLADLKLCGYVLDECICLLATPYRFYTLRNADVLVAHFLKPLCWLQDLPEDYVCPICGAPKSKFESRVKVVAGFAENQKYGLGTNSMTGGQKSLLIYGALAIFFILFLSGYALE